MAWGLGGLFVLNISLELLRTHLVLEIFHLVLHLSCSTYNWYNEVKNKADQTVNYYSPDYILKHEIKLRIRVVIT